MDLSFISGLAQKAQQKQVMTHVMQQSLTILALPTDELAEYITSEVQDNFLLEFEHDPNARAQQIKRKEYQDSLIIESISLFQHLMTQARELFDTPRELHIAEQLIGNLDEKGFYTNPLHTREEEIILKKIQTLDPPGIAAQNLKETLLIQLERQKKGKTLAAILIKDHWETLKQNKLILLLQKLNSTPDKLKSALATISRLSQRPACTFQSDYNSHITIDLILDHDGEKWHIDLPNERLPSFRFAPQAFQAAAALPQKDKQIFQEHLKKGRLLFIALHKREQTLKRIAKYLIKTQKDYLLGARRSLEPLTMQSLAKALSLSESTITRAVKDKYLTCPAGTFAIRHFFTSTIKNGKLLLKQLIDKEDKLHPLSDESLALKLQAQGLQIARRTITKYRRQLRIAPASKRKTPFL